MKGSCHFDKKAKRWFIQIYWEGNKHRFWKHPLIGEPFWAKQSAEKQLNRIRTEVDEGYFSPKHWKQDSPMSIRVYATEWLDCLTVEPKTLSGYKSSVNNYIIPFFKDKDIRRIRHNDFLKFYKWIKRADKGKYNVMSDLRNMLRYAWIHGTDSRRYKRRSFPFHVGTAGIHAICLLHDDGHLNPSNTVE